MRRCGLFFLGLLLLLCVRAHGQLVTHDVTITMAAELPQLLEHIRATGKVGANTPKMFGEMEKMASALETLDARCRKVNSAVSRYRQVEKCRALTVEIYKRFKNNTKMMYRGETDLLTSAEVASYTNQMYDIIRRSKEMLGEVADLITPDKYQMDDAARMDRLDRSMEALSMLSSEMGMLGININDVRSRRWCVKHRGDWSAKYE